MLSDLIDDFMQREGIESINQLAERLGLSWWTADRYHKRHAVPSQTRRKVLAGLMGFDPAKFNEACEAQARALVAA